MDLRQQTTTAHAPTTGRNMFAVIDSLQSIGFFIKDRPNPDVALPGREKLATAQLRIQTLNTQQVEFPDETPMILGAQLPNPYSIPNMTAAYNAFFNTQAATVPVTHRYVRFSPASEAQVVKLEDSLDVERFTYPLDRELLIDGDYYVAPGSSIEDLPQLYAVVDAGFSFPAGIHHTVLSDLHIPDGTLAPYIEELAESMVLGAQYSSSSLPNSDVLISRDDVTLSDGSHPQMLNTAGTCFEIDPLIGIYIVPCPEYPDPPPPLPTPPATSCGLPALNCVNEGYPRGGIRVWDTQFGTCQPVADVRVRSKRWFKVDRDQTDANGNFVLNKKYNRNAKIEVIFRNQELSLKPLRHELGYKAIAAADKGKTGLV